MKLKCVLKKNYFSLCLNFIIIFCCLSSSSGESSSTLTTNIHNSIAPGSTFVTNTLATNTGLCNCTKNQTLNYDESGIVLSPIIKTTPCSCFTNITFVDNPDIKIVFSNCSDSLRFVQLDIKSVAYIFEVKDNFTKRSDQPLKTCKDLANLPLFNVTSIIFNFDISYTETAVNITLYPLISNNTSGAGVTSTTISSTTTDPGNGPLLYAIIAICATVIIVALCCGCICVLKMRYRFTSLRVNFYGQGGMFRRNANGTVLTNPGANEYVTTHMDPSKIEYDKWEVPINDLLIDKTTKLGSGAFASVFKGYLKGKNPLLENIGNINFALEMAENRDNEVAIKMLHSHADDESRDELKKEIAFMKNLGYHPHVLSMIGCVSSIYEPLLIVEYCANGDLLTLLRRHKEYILIDPEADCPAQADFCLNLRDLLSFSWQISDGLVYLSSRNFIHRDIACRNVLITKRMVAKISDFGLCRYSQEALYTTKVGKLPIKWMAIEALKLAEFTSKTDVWSYGVLLYELFTAGDTPYHSIQPSDMLEYLLAGNRLPKPDYCPDELYKMMEEMWAPNPEDRPSFEIIRQRLSAFLEVQSDAYGYIQVSQDYGRFYSRMEFPAATAPLENDVSEIPVTELITDNKDVPEKIVVVTRKNKDHDKDESVFV